MSYDLYFFKRKETDLTRQGIADYLTRNLNVAEANNQWIVEDEDTGTYFGFDLNQPDPETDEEYEDFDYTFFTFNLNFIRPDFFGIHAFRFVDQLVKDLDLYVLNPQEAADTDNPVKPLADELYKNWSALNARHAADFFEEFKLNYLSLEKSNDAYFYRLNRKQLQEDLGEGYFVAGLYFYRKKSDNSIITISSWTDHIPNVFPPADYYLITRQYKKLFRNVKESGLVSSQALFKRFAGLIEDFNFKNCKVIRPANAEKSKMLFNTMPLEYALKDFAESVPVDKIVNSMHSN